MCGVTDSPNSSRLGVKKLGKLIRYAWRREDANGDKIYQADYDEWYFDFGMVSLWHPILLLWQNIPTLDEK